MLLIFFMQIILSHLSSPDCQCDIHGLHGSAAALLLAAGAAARKQPICCIVPREEQLEPLARDIRLFTEQPTLTYPSFEIPAYTPLAPDPATVTARLATLHQLHTSDTAPIILTSAEAVLRRILPGSLLENRSELVMAGEETDRDALISHLIAAGYQQCGLVQQEGDIAVRGSIIDIFCPPSDDKIEGPLRLDFFGDTIESIRVFDPVSQRSLAELEEAVLLPASDILFPLAEEEKSWTAFMEQTAKHCNWPNAARKEILEKLRGQIRFSGIEFSLPLLLPPPLATTSFFSYLQAESLLVLLDPPAIRSRIDLLQERIQTNYKEALGLEQAVLPPDQLFLTQDALHKELDQFPSAHFCTLPDPDSSRESLQLHSSPHNLLRQEIELQRKKAGLLAPLAERMKRWQKEKKHIVLACSTSRQGKHFQDMLANYHIATERIQPPISSEILPQTDAIVLVEHPLAKGFDLPDWNLHLLSGEELFGEKRLAPRSRDKKRPAAGEPVRIEELHTGDVVVHRDHGLGRFLGLFNMEFAGQNGDYMQLEYRDGDKLYVPVDKLHLVSRYQGLSDQEPRLDRLGGSGWQSAKKKVSEAVWKVAQELLDIYAKRKIRRGHVFDPPGELYINMEDSFPYEETVGQQKAIDEVLSDMTSKQPMDRLICGDVGYGKTEVAMRAAFKAIEEGFQVAVLVPTTVLAEQHAASFRDRFATFPVNIACINRFRTPSEQKQIVADLADGKIDLIIGTHRLLSKDIVFKKLGLLIVDEEHRFGVSHKEKIKTIKAEVDVLTLTATPIPRTLQMSLLGIRDLSVISTPPRRRRSVKTFLARHDDLVIREGISRELQRGGQIFFVHNRVRSIHKVANRIQELVPEARIAVAHGQMPGQQLEDIMVAFVNHEIDVLVCTTIIESGLDIPNANTIIINRADHLGLADIYQLRGRVGRASRQAYAYLLVPSLEDLSKDAQERLRALMDANELGSGFKLAMNDLQIRGGGNLLGVSQSGHIAAVGYDLYLELLQSTVAQLKQQAAEGKEQEKPIIEPEIKLQVAAFLPEKYIEDVSQRYHLYRRIAAAGNEGEKELEDLYNEVQDRFGRLPAEAENLFNLIGRKQRLRDFGIAKLEQGPDAMVYSFSEHTSVEPEAILALIKQKPKKGRKSVRLTPDNRLVVPLEPNTTSPFSAIDRLLSQLA